MTHPAEDFELTARREKVASLYLRRKTMREIAELLSVSATTICRDVEVIREQWKASSVSKYEDRVAEKLAELAEIKRAAWDSFISSCGSQSKEMITQGGKFGGQEQVTTWLAAGDKRFLDAIDSAIDKECKILDLYASQKSEVKVTLANMTPEELTEYGKRMGLESPAWATRLFNAAHPGSTSLGHKFNGNGHSPNGNGHAHN